MARSRSVVNIAASPFAVLHPIPSPHIPLLIFSAAVLVSGAIGGRGPAALGAFLSLLVADYFFVPAAGAFKFPAAAADIIGIGAFVAVAGLTVWVAGITRHAASAKTRADTLTDKLNIEGRHRHVNHGLGLGMSIARDILERHGGTITADSASEGRGATFTVRLPVRNAPEPALVPSRISAAG